ncbi:MAG: hypothetical protein Q7S11_03385 [bacterium]|nr:hypothetical protein [bacterium]
MLKKFLSLFLAVVAVCAIVVSTPVPASPINTELAGNPTAAMAEIDKIGLPLSDEQAAEMRGESWAAALVIASIASILYVHYMVYTGRGASLSPAGMDLYMTSISP